MDFITENLLTILILLPTFGALAVLPTARERGIGTALLQAMLRDRAEPRVLLQTHDGDTPAMRLYERAGFRRLAALPPDVALIRDLP